MSGVEGLPVVRGCYGPLKPRSHGRCGNMRSGSCAGRTVGWGKRGDGRVETEQSLPRDVGGAAGRPFPRSFVQELRRRVDIVDLIGAVVALRPAGREFVGLCPFHEERTPSFHVSRDKQVFHCHGCHAGGDVVTFVMRRQALGFAEAVVALAVQVGMTLPDPRPLSAEQRRRLGLQEELYAVCAAAADYFKDSLLQAQGSDAIAYLRRRGVDGPTAERFGLGFAPADWEGLGRALATKFPPERLLQAGLRRERGPGRGAYDYFRGRLMFPIWDERGRVVAFGGRALAATDGPKYLNSPETPIFRKRQTLYALHLARPAIERAGRVVVVEGYMDALTCHQFRFDHAVALLGTALSDAQAGMLMRCAELIVLAFDADLAGGVATERGLAVLQERGAQVAVAPMPAGADPDEALRAEDGPRVFGAALDAAVPLIHYLVRRAIGEANVARMAPEQRWRLAEQMVPFLARVPSVMGRGTRQEYIEHVARALGFREPYDLARAVERHAEKGGGHRNRNTWNPTPVGEGFGRSAVRPAWDAAEETILAVCLRSGEWLRQLLPELSIHDFRGASHKALVARLLQGGVPVTDGGAAGGAEAPGSALLNEEEDPQIRSTIARLLALELPEATAAVLRQCLATMRRARLQEDAGTLRAEQRRLAAEGLDRSAEMLAVTRRLFELTTELARSVRGGGDEHRPPGGG